MQDLIEQIDRALRDRGWSARHASRLIGGSPEFIRNLRRGYVSSLAKVRTLCEVLGLEFYIGPPRAPGAVDERRLEEAVGAVERVLAESRFVLDPEAKAGAVAAAYAIIGDHPSPDAAERVRRLIRAIAAGRRGPGGAEPGGAP